MTSATTVVITDTNVLINFMHVGGLGLLTDLPAYQFKLPQEVLNELTLPGQREAVEAAIATGKMEMLVVEELETLALFGELRELMGRGEAACLALAATSGAHLASDEKRRFKSKAVELIGQDRILRTEDLIVTGIRSELISVEQADEYKAVLAEKRYAMPFSSFAELL